MLDTRSSFAVSYGLLDADKNPFDGGKTYEVTLPKGVPAAKFWSFTV